jgi:hypothetical protein
MSATRSRVTPLHLLAALLIVAGLAMSAPPSCVCASDEHFGLLLHPLFPHVHGAPHSPLATLDFGESGTDRSAPTVADQAPGISAQATGTGAFDAYAGLLLPLVLAALLLESFRRVKPADSIPEQRSLAPPIPPPPLLPSVA